MANVYVEEKIPLKANLKINVKQDLAEDEWFELQPIEKKLCAYSFGLGIVLLAIFILVFEVFK